MAVWALETRGVGVGGQLGVPAVEVEGKVDLRCSRASLSVSISIMARPFQSNNLSSEAKPNSFSLAKPDSFSLRFTPGCRLILSQLRPTYN